MRLVRAALAACLAFAITHARAETVRVTVAYYSAETEPYFNAMAAQFSAAHPGTDIKIEVVTWATLLQKLRTDIVGGTTPDISIIGTYWLLDFVRDGLAEPLDGYMTPQFRARFIPPFLNPATIDGHVYGLPIAASSRAMFYNRKLLAHAGFPDGPKTWDETVTAAERIRATDNLPGIGIQGTGPGTDVYWYYALWTHGGEIVGADGKAAFASPAGVNSLALYKSLVDRGLTEPGPTAYGREDLQNLFKQGRLGMVMTGPFLINQLAHEAPDLDYGIVPVPTATNPATFAVTDSVVLFKSSKVKAAAWAFLDFLFTAAPRVAFTKNEGFLPTTAAEAADPYFADNPRLKVFVDLLPTAHFGPMVTGWQDSVKAITDALQSVYTGAASPEPALRRAAALADQSLGQ